MSFQPMTITRHKLLLDGSTALGSMLCSAEAACCRAFDIKPRSVEQVRLKLPLRNLPAGFSGLTIAQISDLHFSRVVPPSSIRPVVDMVMAAKPDIIVVTGDYVNDLESGEARWIVQELSRLRAPLGSFAVLGNHDHWTDPTIVSAAVRRAGLTLLRNANVAVVRGKEKLYITGVDDVWVNRADLSSALRGIPADACAVLLAHEPDFADDAARDRRIALQLSGHSHGGSRTVFGVPRVLPPWGRKYPEGLRQIAGMYLYTNRGVGSTVPFVRMNCRPEVTLIKMVQKIAPLPRAPQPQEEQRQDVLTGHPALG